MLGIIGIRTIWKPKTGSHWNVWKFVPASEFHEVPGSYFFWQHTSQTLSETMRKPMNRRNQEFTEIQKESDFLRFIDPILRFEPGHSFRKWPCPPRFPWTAWINHGARDDENPHPRQSNMAMKKQPFMDAFPIKKTPPFIRELPLPCLTKECMGS